MSARDRPRLAAALGASAVLTLGMDAARADATLPAPESHGCWAARMTSDPSSCFDCTTSYDAQEACTAVHLAVGRERRCIFRGQKIAEVWCEPSAPIDGHVAAPRR